MSYDILTDTDKLSFIKKVNERINTGWIPFGGISTTFNQNTSCSGSIVYAQAFLTKLDFDLKKGYYNGI